MTKPAGKLKVDIVAMMRAKHGVPVPADDRQPPVKAKQPFSLVAQMRARHGMSAEQETSR